MANLCYYLSTYSFSACCFCKQFPSNIIRIEYYSIPFIRTNEQTRHGYAWISVLIFPLLKVYRVAIFCDEVMELPLKTNNDAPV